MNRLLFLFFCFPFFLFSQNWNQIGLDIDAEHRDDYNGYSVSYSDDGNRLAIGAIQNDNIQGNGAGSNYIGHVRIFENINGNWVQVGQDIDGTSGVYEFFGSSVSLSSDGNIVAIGAPFIAPGSPSYGAGLVRVYEFDGTNWNQRGSDILASGGSTGYSVDVSDDGRKVIVGSPNWNSNNGSVRIYDWNDNILIWEELFTFDGTGGQMAGHSVSINGDATVYAFGSKNGCSGRGCVDVYYNNGVAIIPMGTTISGYTGGDAFGYSVSLSNDGNRIAAGAKNNDGNGVGTYTGLTVVYQFISGPMGGWSQLGGDIVGESIGDAFGYSVSLSNDGNKLAVGAPQNDGNGNNSGHVRIFELSNSSWNQISQDIDGEYQENQSGHSVSLSGDGSKVAIGAPNNCDEYPCVYSGNMYLQGHVRAYTNIVPVNGCTDSTALNYDPSANTDDSSCCYTEIIEGSSTILLGDTVTLSINPFDTIINGFTYGGEYNGSHYFISDNPLDWKYSDSICIVHGGHLATISDMGENSFVTSLSNSNLWIGFNDESSEGSFVWSNGEANTFDNWAIINECTSTSNQPDNGGTQTTENYTHIYENCNEWNDYPNSGYSTCYAVLEIDDFFTASNILWSTTDTTISTSDIPSQTTNYWVQTNQNGNICSDTVTITVYIPFSNLPDSIIACDSVQICVDSIAGGSYSWGTSNISTSGNLAIGDTYQGGLVFYLDGNGGGLIVSPVIGNANWGCYGTNLAGADGTAIGTGMQNTIDIIAGCTTSTTAADLCANLTLGGHNDWFLPSKDELHQLFINSIATGIPFQFGDTHWSSSEGDATGAWLQIFVGGWGGTGNQQNGAKVNTYPVRAVRSVSSFVSPAIDTLNCVWVSNTGWNYITITTANGITATDSVYVSLNTPVSGSSSVSACDTYTWEGQTITSSGNLTHTYQNTSGCDSVHTLSVTINSPTTSTTTESSCDSYDWNGNTYNSSGTYTFNTTNANGCDSIATLDLSINTSSTSISTVTNCDNFSWNGTVYTSSGIYTYTSLNATGCTNVDSLILTIFNQTSSTFKETACDSYSWNGTIYTSTGIYSYTTTNSNGCDSIANLELSINTTTTSITSETSCDNYTWNGNTYNSSGSYTYTLTNSNGCDSTATLELILSLLDVSDITTNTSCNEAVDGSAEITVTGGIQPYSYSWDSGQITQDLIGVRSGNYILTVTDSNLCSKTINISVNEPEDLIVDPYVTNASCEVSDDASIDITPYGGTMPYTYLWSNGQITEDLQNIKIGEYTVLITDFNGCQKLDSINVDFDGSDNCFFIPTLFTPNGDGINDTWLIDGLDLYPDILVQVYNRWGQLLFESLGYANKWDGTHNGNELPIGAYYYVIDLNNDTDPLNGPITIKR